MMKQQNDSFFCGYNEQTESAAVQAVVIKKHRPEKQSFAQAQQNQRFFKSLPKKHDGSKGTYMGQRVGRNITGNSNPMFMVHL